MTGNSLSEMDRKYTVGSFFMAFETTALKSPFPPGDFPSLKIQARTFFCFYGKIESTNLWAVSSLLRWKLEGNRRW